MDRFFAAGEQEVPHHHPMIWLTAGFVAARVDGNDVRARKLWAHGYRRGSPAANQDPGAHAMLGVLSGQMTNQEARSLVESAIRPGAHPLTDELVRQGLLPIDFCASVLLDLQHNTNARAFLERWICFDFAEADAVYHEAMIVAGEVLRGIMAGERSLGLEVTPIEEQVLWVLVEQGRDAYLRGDLSGHQIVYLHQLCSDHDREAAWEAIEGTLDVAIYGRLAYVAGRMYQRRGQFDVAQQFLQKVTEVAGPLDPLARLAAQVLRRPEGAGRPVPHPPANDTR